MLRALMPVLRGSVTFTRFRAETVGERAKDVRRWAQRALKRRAFEPIDRASEDERAAGWVEIEHNDRTDFSPGDVIFGEHLLAAYRVDRLRVPASVLRAELDAWIASYEADHGFPPKRSEKRQQKELITRKLRNRVFPASRTYDVSWSLSQDQVGLWTASPRLVEEIQAAFEETFEVRLHQLTPGVIAESLDVPAGMLLPTAELIGSDLAADVGARAGRVEA